VQHTPKYTLELSEEEACDLLELLGNATSCSPIYFALLDAVEGEY
jgi:hypothetical protein